MKKKVSKTKTTEIKEKVKDSRSLKASTAPKTPRVSKTCKAANATKGVERDGRIKPMEKKEIRILAKEIAEGSVFTSRHLGKQVDLLPVVFMPLIFGGLNPETEYLRDNAKKEDGLGLIYEYYKASGPRAINGFPTFTSCRLLNQKDTEEVFKLVKEYEKIREKFVEG